MTRHTAYLIIGAGPAGLQLGYFLGRAGLDYQILERAPHAGSFFATFPRHRRLISTNKVETGFDDAEKNLRWDWNSLLGEGPRFTELSTRYFPHADVMVNYLTEFARRHALRIQYGAEVLQIRRSERFEADTTTGRWTADRIIVATGTSRDNTPSIPGLEHSRSYREMSIDPNEFRGRRVLIVGKGNSAFETADNLVETAAAIHLVSPTPIRMAWKTHFVGHLRAVNNNVLDTYQLKSQNTIIDADVESIARDDDMLTVSIHYRHAHDQRISLRVHDVLCCTGFAMDTSIFGEGCVPALVPTGRFPRLTSSWESENVPGLYFAGTLMQSRDYHRTFSAFIHGFRYNIDALVHVLLERHHDTPWPARTVRGGVEELVEVMMARIDASSALFQQPGFLADVIRVRGGTAIHLESVPVERFLEQAPQGGDDLDMVLTLEYGHGEHPDPFNIDRFPDQGTSSHFIHPVVRVLRRGRQTAEYHVPEDLENDWSAPFYREPFGRFLQSELPAVNA